MKGTSKRLDGYGYVPPEQAWKQTAPEDCLAAQSSPVVVGNEGKNGCFFHKR